MKKNFVNLFALIFIFSLTGCTETTTTDEVGNTKTEFGITETATVNDTNITINSVKKIANDCFWEYDGECQSYTNPENAFFLLIDLTIENKSSDEISVSSLMTFDLKDSTGEKGKYALLTTSITSQLDGSVMAGDLLKGQIAFDVKESDKYYFYYQDSLFDNTIKFIINSSDITE